MTTRSYSQMAQDKSESSSEPKKKKRKSDDGQSSISDFFKKNETVDGKEEKVEIHQIEEDENRENLCKKLTELIYQQKRIVRSRKSHAEYENLKKDFLKEFPKYKGKTDDELVKILFALENELGTYFGEHLSDDSDSDDEDSFRRMKSNDKRTLLNHTNQIIKYAGVQEKAIKAAKEKAIELNLLSIDENEKNKEPEELKNKRKRKKSTQDVKPNKRRRKSKRIKKSDESDTSKNKKPGDKNRRKYLPHQLVSTRKTRQKIHRQVELTKQVRQDFNMLEHHLREGTLSEGTIGQINTEFVVLQCRGYHFYLNIWSKHERDNEWKKASCEDSIGKPIYAGATVQYTRKNESYNDSKDSDETSLNRQICAAKEIQERLRILKLSGAVRIIAGSDNNFTFDNALSAIQDIYTKNYEKFHKALSINREENPDLKIKTLYHLILFSLGVTENPFVSTSDLPEHALQYALGSKPYKGFNDHLRLRPRWRETGEPERPHSGIVYASLHEPLELLEDANHLLSMNNVAEFSTPDIILSERETSFLGLIPGGRIFHIHKARFPSFHKNYKEIYLFKYGFNKYIYELYQILIKGTKPHSNERKWVKDQISSCLVAYYEASIIDAARMEAENTKRVLIYRSEYGEFTLDTDPVNVKVYPSGDKPHIIARRDYLNEKIKKRQDEIPKSGFLYDIQRRFTCSSLGMISTSEMLANLCKKYGLIRIQSDQDSSSSSSSSSSSFTSSSSSSSSTSYDSNFTFDKLCVELEKVANQSNVRFFIHNAEYYKNHKKPCVSGERNTGKEIHLYYCGGGLIRLLEEKSKKTAAQSSSETNFFSKQRRSVPAIQKPEKQMETNESTGKISNP